MPSDVHCMSGTLCPTSGEWEILGPVGTIAYFKKGQIMPLYLGKKVVWVLIRQG